MLPLFLILIFIDNPNYLNLTIMTVKNLFIFGAIVAAFFGIVLMFAPEALAKNTFVNPDLSATALSIARNYGIVLFSIGIAIFSARNSVPSAARRGYLIQLTVSGILLSCHSI